MDASAEAAKIFPDGMPRGAAIALLRANGFGCDSGKGESNSGGNRLSCQREEAFLCVDRYAVKLDFDGEDRVANRSATLYTACP